jgi:hypothetical protein
MNSRTLALIVLSLSALLISAFVVIPDSTAAGPLDGVTVCLDPGHGGSDPGAVNQEFGLQESVINLDVSYGLKELLEEQGAAVVMTRTDDSYLTNRDRYTYCNGQLATILVSIHTNSVTDPTWDGSMALYAPSRDPDLAQAIHDQVYPFLRDTAPPDVVEFRDFGLDHFASGVLFKCDMPAAMMEPLFMSHPAEAALLVQPIYPHLTGEVPGEDCTDFSCRRGQIAWAIREGVLNYFSIEPPPTPEPGSQMHVAAVDMWYQKQGANFNVYTRALVEDTTEDPLPGATVALTVVKPDGETVAYTGLTGDDGAVTFSVRSKLTGVYESAVTSVSKEGWTYDPASNLVTGMELLVP